MALWIDPDSFLDIQHFTLSDRESLAKMISSYVIKAKTRWLKKEETADILQTAHLGIIKAFNTYKKNLTISHCYNYVRSEIRNEFFSMSKENDVTNETIRAEMPNIYQLDRLRSDNNETYHDLLHELQKILTDVEFSIFIDRIVHEFTMDEIYHRHRDKIEVSSKTFKKHVNLIIEKARNCYVAAS